jgi:hypothetical protein
LIKNEVIKEKVSNEKRCREVVDRIKKILNEYHLNRCKYEYDSDQEYPEINYDYISDCEFL